MLQKLNPLDTPTTTTTTTDDAHTLTEYGSRFDGKMKSKLSCCETYLPLPSKSTPQGGWCGKVHFADVVARVSFR